MSKLFRKHESQTERSTQPSVSLIASADVASDVAVIRKMLGRVFGVDDFTGEPLPNDDRTRQDHLASICQADSRDRQSPSPNHGLAYSIVVRPYKPPAKQKVQLHKQRAAYGKKKMSCCHGCYWKGGRQIVPRCLNNHCMLLSFRRSRQM